MPSIIVNIINKRIIIRKYTIYILSQINKKELLLLKLGSKKLTIEKTLASINYFVLINFKIEKLKHCTIL